MRVHKRGKEIIHYDRGWDVKPRFFQFKRRAVLRAILAHYDGPEFERRIREAKQEVEAPGD